jgi:hypothetical protein
MDVEKVAAGLIVKPWIVTVTGFSEQTYFAASRGKALAQAWGSYSSCFDEVTFGEFLKRANAYAGVGNDRFGEPIKVSGRPAYMVSWNQQYIQFVYPGSDVVLNSHPLDVEPPEARRGTPYYRPESGHHG